MPALIAIAGHGDEPGEPFWRPESYDHLVQNEREFERIVAYLENNPVTAGLDNRPEEFAWSSAGVATAGT